MRTETSGDAVVVDARNATRRFISISAGSQMTRFALRRRRALDASGRLDVATMTQLRVMFCNHERRTCVRKRDVSGIFPESRTSL